MFEKIIEKLKAGAEVPASTNADVPTSSQTIAKPNVSRSIFFWFKKEFGVLTIDECKNLQLTFCHNIYGDSINHLNCRSIWCNSKGKSYRCHSLCEPS